jgi:hypothetical protein
MEQTNESSVMRSLRKHPLAAIVFVALGTNAVQWAYQQLASNSGPLVARFVMAYCDMLPEQRAPINKAVIEAFKSARPGLQYGLAVECPGGGDA